MLAWPEMGRKEEIMSEFTKGEWTTNGTIIQDEKGLAIAQVWPKTNLSSEESVNLMKANACLIAAAPDLLEACEKAFEESHNPKVEKILEAAIAKATHKP